jgi:hypothetical protein
MKKFAITLSLALVVITLLFSSCTGNKKTLGCPGMITKAEAHSSAVRS